MGRGVIDHRQFRALKNDGYRHAVARTHWRAGTPEASSRDSFAGMKALLSAGAV